MSYYRTQPAAWNVEQLLDPEEQYSLSRCTDTARNGVSVCDSIEDLGEYIATVGLEYDPSWVVVELDGYPSDEDDEDAALGASLIHPTEIISVTPAAEKLDAIISQVWEANEAQYAH